VGDFWYNGIIAWDIDESRTIVYVSGSGNYAEISMASEYIHEEFESPAKMSNASVIER
jgi:hypothetical protein